MIGLRTGLSAALRTGLAAGLSADELGGGVPPIQLDGSSALYRPTLITDWAQMVATGNPAGWRIPTFRFPCQEASGAMVCDVRGVTMAAAGTVEYQVASAVASYASRGVGLTEAASEGFTAIAGALWNAFTQATVHYLEIEIRADPADGTSRSLLALTGSTSLHVSIIGVAAVGPRLSARGAGGNVNGTISHSLNVRYGVVVKTRPGAGTLDFANPAVYTVASNLQPAIAGTFPNSTDGVKGLGAGNNAGLTAANVIISDHVVWTGEEADAMILLTDKQILEGRGHVVAY